MAFLKIQQAQNFSAFDWFPTFLLLLVVVAVVVGSQRFFCCQSQGTVIGHRHTVIGDTIGVVNGNMSVANDSPI